MQLLDWITLQGFLDFRLRFFERILITLLVELKAVNISWDVSSSTLLQTSVSASGYVVENLRRHIICYLQVQTMRR